MKTLKFTVLISLLAISSVTFASSGKKTPPVPPADTKTIVEKLSTLLIIKLN